MPGAEPIHYVTQGPLHFSLPRNQDLPLHIAQQVLNNKEEYFVCVASQTPGGFILLCLEAFGPQVIQHLPNFNLAPAPLSGIGIKVQLGFQSIQAVNRLWRLGASFQHITNPEFDLGPIILP